MGGRLIFPAMEKKKTIKRNNIKEFGGRNVPEASQGKTRDVPGTPGTLGPIYVEIPIQGAQCPRDRRGHVHRTDGTHTTGQTGHTPEVSRQNSLCLLVSFSPCNLDGQNRQSPIASDFGSRTQIAARFAVLLYRNV